jgi:hypothetical protein
MVYDCNLVCADVEWVGDDVCDDGTLYDADFDCEEFEFDAGDCDEPVSFMWIDEHDVSAGSTVTIPLKLDSLEEVAGWELYVTWDPFWFTVEDVDAGSLMDGLSGLLFDGTVDESAGELHYLSFSLDGSTIGVGAGSVINIVVDVAADTPAGSYEFGIHTAVLASPEGLAIDLETENGWVHVTAPPPPPAPCAELGVDECAAAEECVTIDAWVTDSTGCVDWSVPMEPVGCMDADMMCGEALTWAESPTGECMYFPTTCTPAGWGSCSGCE